MSSRELQATIKAQKGFINELLDRLESNKTDVTVVEKNIISKDTVFIRIQKYDYPLSVVETLLNDFYFNNLTLEQILDLAKKSIRLTSDNSTMLHKLEDISEILDNSDLSQQIKRIIDRENQFDK